MPIRLIPKTDDAAFPYEEAMRLLQANAGINFKPKDFAPMIAAGTRLGWTVEMIRANEELARRGNCFEFASEKAPFLRGSLFEDNVFFSFSGAKHEHACVPEIERLAKLLDVRVLRH